MESVLQVVTTHSNQLHKAVKLVNTYYKSSKIYLGTIKLYEQVPEMLWLTENDLGIDIASSWPQTE